MTAKGKRAADAAVARIDASTASEQTQDDTEQRRDETPDQPRPVRMTVVLGPVEYDRLQTFTHEAQRQTGRRGVAASEVTRRALARVLGDDTLRRELVEEIRREGGNRRAESGKRTRS